MTSAMRRLDGHRTWLLYMGVVGLAQTTGWTVAAVYLVQEVGMGPLELVLAGTALEVAYFLCEVPTGIVADVYSRRASVVAGQLIMGAGFILTGAVAEVGVVLAAAALIGFGWTFRSGAEDAWLADEVGPERLARWRLSGPSTSARSLSHPVFATWLNANIEDSRVRATVISITNLGDPAGEWAGGPVLGAIGSVFSIRAALAVGAVALTPALWLYGRAIRLGGDPS